MVPEMSIGAAEDIYERIEERNALERSEYNTTNQYVGESGSIFGKLSYRVAFRVLDREIVPVLRVLRVFTVRLVTGEDCCRK